MKPKPTPKRYRLFRKGAYGTFYIEDAVTRRQTSLKTKDRGEAERLLQAHCESAEAPDRAYRVGMAYVGGVDPESGTRTWKDVIDAYAKMHPEGSSTRHRIQTAGKDRSIAHLLRLPLLRTRPDDLLVAVQSGKVSTNAYLRRFQNFAVDLNWLPRPIIPKKRWPKIRHHPKRAITEQEHRQILERETNAERKAFYALLWHLGGSSSDVANLQAENIDWVHRTLCYNRRKTAQFSGIRFGPECEAILRRLPTEGPLFPYLASVRAGDRATEFRQRCQGLGIVGITLHSYRYSWAERAKQAGMPERFAQAALGHSSKAVHRAYARGAIVEIPCLEELEPAKPETHGRPAGTASPGDSIEPAEFTAPIDGVNVLSA
jgi:integrase